MGVVLSEAVDGAGDSRPCDDVVVVAAPPAAAAALLLTGFDSFDAADASVPRNADVCLSRNEDIAVCSRSLTSTKKKKKKQGSQNHRRDTRPAPQLADTRSVRLLKEVLPVSQ